MIARFVTYNGDENWILKENLLQYILPIPINGGWTVSNLIGGAAVIVPDRKFLDAAGRLVQGLGLAAETLPRPVYPDVQSLHSKLR